MNKWQQTIKLGKNVVLQKLGDYGIGYDRKMNYFKLCSLLYQHEKALHAEEQPIAQPLSSCVGVTREKVKIIAQKEWDLAHMKDYRQRYLSMTSYINYWFDRVSNGELTVNAGVLINAQQMWEYYRLRDRYSGIKRTYDYLYQHDIQNNEIEPRRLKYKDFKQIYGLFR